MSASNPGPGRPPGISEATLEKQRRVREMDKLGIPRATIAAVEKCSTGYVGMLINGGAKEDGSPESAADIEPPQPRRLSRRAAQVRAWEYAEQHVISKLGLAVDAFWVRIVVAIHQEGDGYRLNIGEQGSRFKSREDLADLFGRREVDITGCIAALIERGRLKEVGDIDIGIPHGMKLTPTENIRSKPVANRAAQPPQDGQVPMLHSVSGGLSDATEIPPQTQLKPQLNLRSDELNLRSAATEIPEGANLTPIKLQRLADERAAAAAAYAKESNSLAAAAAADSRAGGATETRIKFAPDATEIPSAKGGGATEINLQRSPVAVLTEELVALAGLGRPPNADDLSIVEAWLDVGETADTLRAGIEIKLGQRNGKPPSTLRYFDGFLTERRKARRRSFPSSQTQPAPTREPDPEPPEEPIVGTSIEAQWARVDRAVRKAIGKQVHYTWMRKACFDSIDGDEVTIRLTSPFDRDYVRKNFQVHLLRAWQTENPEVRRINLVADDPPPQAAD